MIVPLIHTLFRMYYMLIFIRIIISWFPDYQYNEWIRKIGKLTDPYLDLFSRFIPPIGMVDISPIIALFALNVIENILFAILSAIVII